MATEPEFPYGGAGDSRAAGLALQTRFRRHAGSLVANHRSPLYARLMYGAADDLAAGGVVADLFEGISTPPGAVPQLRLMAAMHQLVLSDGAPDLARFYPSAGGTEPPDDSWAAAENALRANFDWIKGLGLTVQTNEPGRSAVLFAVLLWLTDRYRLAIRLLELGASAGLNLLADRYCYVAGGEVYGEPTSSLRFEEPWRPPPPIRLRDAAANLRISDRAGCDRSPLDPREAEDRMRLVSYIWPDEPDRIRRIEAAMDIAARAPVPVIRGDASEWLPGALAGRRAGELTVVWHSLVRQYVEPEEWVALQSALREARAAAPELPIVRVGMEPDLDHLAAIELAIDEPGDASPIRLAACGDHGPPVIWERSAARQYD